MTEEEERFVHFVSSIDKLNNAWRILKEIKRHTDHSLLGPAFRFALVEYSKPYTVSHGAELDVKGKPKNKYLLDKRYIPEGHHALHDRLIDARKKIHAHDDLSVKEAKLYVKNTHGKIVGAEFSSLESSVGKRVMDCNPIGCRRLILDFFTSLEQ